MMILSDSTIRNSEINMLDISKIIGLKMFAKNDAALTRLKHKIISIIDQIEDEDMFVIEGKGYFGSNGIGAILNYPICNDLEQFSKSLRSAFNTIGAIDADCNKYFFIISEKQDILFQQELKRITNVNEKKYHCTIYNNLESLINGKIN